jgi:hypothetical protein
MRSVVKGQSDDLWQRLLGKVLALYRKRKER